MLVGRDLNPGRSVTPESHRPAVVIGLYADCVFRARSGSGRGGERRDGDSIGGVIFDAGGMAIGEGTVAPVERRVVSLVGDSEEVRSIVVGRASSLMRSNSTLRFVCLSSSLSGSA